MTKGNFNFDEIEQRLLVTPRNVEFDLDVKILFKRLREIEFLDEINASLKVDLEKAESRIAQLEQGLRQAVDAVEHWVEKPTGDWGKIFLESYNVHSD